MEKFLSPLERAEYRCISRALKRFGGCRKLAAKYLGITERGLRNKIKKQYPSLARIYPSEYEIDQADYEYWDNKLKAA